MSPGTSTDDPESIVQRWFDDLFSRGESSVADEILAEDVEYHGPPSLSPKEVTGPDDIREYVEVYQSAFPDLHYTVEESSRVDDEVHVRWSATGTHQSDLFDMESTGETFTVEGIDRFTLEDGLITEVRAQWDTLKMVQELGIVPPVGLAAE